LHSRRTIPRTQRCGPGGRTNRVSIGRAPWYTQAPALPSRRGSHRRALALVMTRNPSSSEAAPGGAARRERADGASRTPVPRRLRLALASLTEAPPRGPDWVHEVKFDGYRLAGHLEGRSARLMTRNGLDWTERFPVVAEHVAALAAAGTVIDGEVVALDTGGRPSFGALQRAASPRSSRSRPTRSALAYQAFDLLFLGGLDIRDAPLEQRKAALRQLLDEY